MHRKFAEAILGVKTASFSQDKLETLAKIASQRYIKNGTALTDSIAKLAETNDLTKHAVERVCEMSNMFTHAALLPSESEKRAGFGFPLADSKIVIASLRKKASPGPSIISDYTTPPSGHSSGGPTMDEMFGVSGSCGHDGFAIPERSSITIVIEKKAALRNRKYDELVKTAMLCEAAEKEAENQIKQAVIRGSDLEGIHKAACDAGLGALSQELMPKVASSLNKKFLVSNEQLEKVAFKAPEELIDRSVPVRIINGAHPIIASLDTLKRYQDSSYTIRDGLVQIDDEVKVLQQRLKELE